MADEHNNPKSEDEYKFPEDEYVHAQAEPAADNSLHDSPGVSSGGVASGIVGKIQDLSKNRIAVVIVLVVVLLILIRIFGGHESTKIISTTPVKAISTPVVAAKPQPVVSLPNPQVVNEVGTIKDSLQRNKQVLNNLQSRIDDVQAALQANLTQQSQLLSSVNDLESKISIIQKKIAPKKKKKLKVAVKPVIYYLRAIVPGRAWIYGSNGRSATIALGDRVKQYGKVMSILAHKGKVLTSSGKVIEFSSSDQ
jgi:intracellular multiplication protein IcmG